MSTQKERVAQTRTHLSKAKGDVKELRKSKEAFEQTKTNILTDLPSHLQELDSLRVSDSKNNKAHVDLSLAEYAADKYNFAVADDKSPLAFLNFLGVNPAESTLESLSNMAEFPEAYRWLRPEVIREAVRLGLKKEPIYKKLIAGEERVTQPSVTMPYVKQSAAMPKKLAERETIPMGRVSFGEKKVSTTKVGVGIDITDEVRQFVPLNILSLFLGDVGVKMNLAKDNEFMNVLINGDQADGSESSAVIGVDTVNTLSYLDILKVWVRTGRMGKLADAMVTAEAMGIDILQLEEFKGFQGQNKTQNILLQSAIPSQQNLFIHGAVTDANNLIFVDSSMAVVKLNVTALRIESARVAEAQLSQVFATERTGFANLFRDARLIVNKSLDFAGNPFPEWFDIDSYERETYEE